MKTWYIIGTNQYPTKASAVRKAKEYANADGEPVRVQVEKTKYRPGFMGRQEVQDVQYTEFFVEPDKPKEPRPVRVPVDKRQMRLKFNPGMMSMRDRSRLRKKQNQLIKLAEAAGYNDSIAIDEGGPTIGQMREIIYPEWEGTIDRVIADLKSRRRHNPTRLPGEPDEAKLLAKARKPGNNIRTMARIQQQAHDWGLYSVTAVVGQWMREVGATQDEMERYWLKRPPEDTSLTRYRNPSPGWFDRCMAGVSRSGSAVDPGAVCGAMEKKMGYSRRRNAKYAVPGIAKWNMYAGGTSAAPGKHSYDLYIAPGNLAGGQRQYSISPISNQYGRHRGYQLSVAGSPESSGLHKQLGMFRSPSAAAAEARRHYEWSSGQPGDPRYTKPNSRAPQFKISPFGARQILAQITGQTGADFHTLSSSQVDELLAEANKIGYRKSKSAPGSRGRMFYQYLQRVARRTNGGKRTRGSKLVAKRRQLARRAAYGRPPSSRKKNPGRYVAHIPSEGGRQAYQITVSANSIDDARREVAQWYKNTYHSAPGLPAGTNVFKTAGHTSKKFTGLKANRRRRNAKRELSVPEKHQLKIARDTLRMPDAMAGVMGGPTKAQAREIIYRLTGQKPKENRRRRNRKIHTPTASGRTIRAVERRISGALRRYASRKPNRTRRRRY